MYIYVYYTACGAVGGLSSFQSGHLPAKTHDGWIEVSAVKEEVMFRSELPIKHLPHGLRLQHPKGGGGFDGDIDAAMLAKIVPCTG